MKWAQSRGQYSKILFEILRMADNQLQLIVRMRKINESIDYLVELSISVTVKVQQLEFR